MGSMSKRRRIKATAAPMVPTAFVGGGRSYFAAQESSARGRLVLPNQDTAKQLSPWERLTLILKSRVLVENYGPAKAILNLAELIGALKPQAQSGDRAWDVLAEARFDQIANSALSFDRAGMRTFYQWQTFATFRRFVDGDYFSVLTESTSGSAAVAGREAHQCYGGEGDGWNDGVLCDSNGYALAYNFRSMQGGKDYRLAPQNVHHHATWPTLGGTRGVPVFAHAINNFHDIIETTVFWKQSIKTAARIGLTRRADQQHGMAPSNFGLGSAVKSDAYSPPGSSGTAPADERVMFEDVFGGGIVSSVPLETLHDDRPHPNADEFQKRLMREAAIGIGVPPQILFFMDAPGGAEVRTLLEQFDRFVKGQHNNYLRPFCQRFWTYCIAKEMKAGRLPYPSKGDFWKVRWCAPKSITADLGRMGNLTIELRKAALMSDATHYESQGLDYETELDQVGSELALRMAIEEKYGLQPGAMTAALMPPNYPQQQSQQPAA